MPTKKKESKAVKTRKAMFATMETDGSLWPKSSKTGMRTKPRKAAKKAAKKKK